MKKTRYIAVLLGWCMAIQGLWAQPFFEVVPLPFNTSYSNEIAAIPYGDGLIYCANRKANVLVNWIDFNNQPLYRLYFVHQKDSLKWGTSKPFKGLPSDAHQGPCSISADGTEIYYTFNRRDIHGIYSAHKSGDGWGNIRPFEYNNPDYKTAHPSLSSDGKRLFFACDMPGGYGGFDIYYCEKTAGGWGTPKNLGPEVNSTDDELYPFIQSDGILYFSSYGHGSMGGLDIFSVHEIGETWGMRQQLEAPLNSERDDFAYSTVDADGMNGYFSSNRNGKTYDIFSFRSLFPTFAEYKPQEKNDYTYEFFDENSANSDTVKVTFRYEWVFSDGAVEQGEVVKHTFASTGHYTATLNMVDILTGEISKQAAVFEFDVLDIEQPYITVGEPIRAGVAVPFDASETYLPDMEIEGYYWIFSDGIRVKGERVEHIFVSPGTYQVQLGVVGKSVETGEQTKACSFIEVTVK